MRTPAQRRNLLILRDEILPGIARGKLRMCRIFHSRGSPSCLLGHAFASGKFPMIVKDESVIVDGEQNVFGLDVDQWNHIFGPLLPNNPSWLAANITDLLESEL